MLGIADTLGITAVLLAYLAACSIPPFLMGRASRYHPVWRGAESFACYLLVSLVLGAVFAASSEGSWTVLSGISASGAAWARLGSVAVLAAAFVFASWLGGESAEAHRKRVKNRKRRKRADSA